MESQHLQSTSCTDVVEATDLMLSSIVGNMLIPSPATPSSTTPTLADLSPGAANRFPDQCEANPSAARDLNITATERLAKLTSARSILLIYISTDYVFPGPPGEAPYEATSATRPPNLYGQTKLDGEKVMLEVAGEQGLGVILRVPVLYGAVEDTVGNKESAINVLMDAVWKAQGKEAEVVMDDWAQRYPTNTEDVARVLVDLATKYLEAGEGRTGLPRVLQFSSEDRMTKYQICQLLAEIMGLPLDGMIANKDGGGGVQRPYDTHLSSQSLKDLGISTRTMDFTAWWYVEL